MSSHNHTVEGWLSSRIEIQDRPAQGDVSPYVVVPIGENHVYIILGTIDTVRHRLEELQARS